MNPKVKLNNFNEVIFVPGMKDSELTALETIDTMFEKIITLLHSEDDLINMDSGEVVTVEELYRMRGIIGFFTDADRIEVCKR